MDELSIDEVKVRLNNINSYVGECLIRINKGEFLDLSNLNDQITTICGSIDKIDNSEDKKLVSDLMADLVGRLDRLEISIKDKQEFKA